MFKFVAKDRKTKILRTRPYIEIVKNIGNNLLHYIYGYSLSKQYEKFRNCDRI